MHILCLRQQRGLKAVLVHATSTLVKMNVSRTMCMLCILPEGVD
jgi:hypothetical protein